VLKNVSVGWFDHRDPSVGRVDRSGLTGDFSAERVRCCRGYVTPVMWAATWNVMRLQSWCYGWRACTVCEMNWCLNEVVLVRVREQTCCRSGLSGPVWLTRKCTFPSLSLRVTFFLCNANVLKTKHRWLCCKMPYPGFFLGQNGSSVLPKKNVGLRLKCCRGLNFLSAGSCRPILHANYMNIFKEKSIF